MMSLSLEALAPIATLAAARRLSSGASPSAAAPTQASQRNASFRASRQHLRHHLSVSRQRDVSARSSFGEGPPQDSAFLNSEIVQKEAAEIFKDFQLLSQMQPKYLSFDTEGKRLYIEHMEGFVEKLKIFTFRYELSSDPYAKETIRMLNEKLALGGLTIKTLTQQMGVMLTTMKTDLEKEAARGVTPVTGPGSKAYVQGGPFDAGGMPDIAKLLEDPMVRDALMDPTVIKAVQDVMANPAAINKQEYRDNPKLALLFLKMFNAQRDAQTPPGS